MKERPKSFWNPFGEETLLECSFRLASAVAEPEFIFVVTTREHAGGVQNLLHGLPLENIIIEPLARGTTAAIGLASLRVAAKYPDCVCAVLGSDYYLPDTLKFAAAVALSAEAARAGPNLVSVGIKPADANTAYGYMSCGAPWRDGSDIKLGLSYHEKPDAKTAERYLESGNMLWNANIFVWSMSTILACYDRFVTGDFHRLLEVCKALSAGQIESSAAIFRSMSGGSIDFDIMEKIGPGGEMQHLFLAYDGAWSDVGTFPNLRSLLRAPDSNAMSGSSTATNSRDCMLISESPFKLAAYGLHGLDVVVNYRGDLLVCANDASDNRHRQGASSRRLKIGADSSTAGIINLRRVSNLRIEVKQEEVLVRAGSAGPLKAPIDLHIAPDSDAGVRHAATLLADSLADSLSRRERSIFVPSAGKTSHAIFKHLRDCYRHSLAWDRLIVVQMDEYEGVSCEHPGSFAYQLMQELIEPMDIKAFMLINDKSGRPNRAPEDYEREVSERGGIDVILHGLGRNGHLGFNEPGTAFDGRGCIQQLSPGTIIANFAGGEVPSGFTGSGFTLGLGTMLAAKRVILSAFGQEKHSAVKMALDDVPSPRVPASILQMHCDVSFVVDRAAYFGEP